MARPLLNSETLTGCRVIEGWGQDKNFHGRLFTSLLVTR